MASKPLPSQYVGPFESPGFLLWRISNTWQRQQRAALQSIGLTHTQFVMLAAATWFGAETALTQMKLAQLTGSDPMTTSQVVRALMKNGLFERVPHPTDTRAKVISVTTAGREFAQQAVTIVEAVDHQFFQPLGSNQAVLVGLFQKLL